MVRHTLYSNSKLLFAFIAYLISVLFSSLMTFLCWDLRLVIESRILFSIILANNVYIKFDSED